MSKRAASVGLTVAWLLRATPALAHIELLDPVPRAYGQSEGNLKSQPCGQTVDGRTDRVNAFRPGETITVRWNEFANHQSYFRIAFEIDGDDFVQRPPQNLSAATDDPVTEEAAIDVGQLLAVVEDTGTGEHSATVTLPTEECETCTLQVVQFMYGRADSYYYQCADIALRNDGGSGTGGSATADGTGGGGASGGMGGSATDGTPGGTTGGTQLVGDTGGTPTSGGTGGAIGGGATGRPPFVGDTGGALVFGDTGGAAAVGGTGGDGVGAATSVGATGGQQTGGALPAVGGELATTGGVSFETGGTGTGTAVASGTGGEWEPAHAGWTVDPDSPMGSSDATDHGVCSSAGPAPSRTGGLGFAMLLGLVLVRRRSLTLAAPGLACGPWWRTRRPCVVRLRRP